MFHIQLIEGEHMHKLKVILMMAGLVILFIILSKKEDQKKEEIQEDESPKIVITETSDDTKRIRVVLKTNDGTGIHHDRVTLIPDTDYEVICHNQSKIYHAGEEFSVSGIGNEYFDSKHEKILIIPLSVSAKTAVLTLKRGQDAPVYRGAFELQCNEGGLVIINDLPVEEYLYAVVPSEMPSDYPIEALKAQAICARTYALKQMQYSKYTEIGANVDDSTSFQVYNYIGECSAVNQAVDATNGKVVTYGGKVKDTYYFSTSCGYTTDGGAWKTDTDEDMDYLKGKKLSEEAVEAWNVVHEDESVIEKEFDSFIRGIDDTDYESQEPWYRWNVNIVSAALAGIDTKISERFMVNPNKILTRDEDGIYHSTEPPAIGEIRDISIASRGEGGVIESLIVEGSNATIQILTEYNIRYILSAEGASIQRQNGETVVCGKLLPSAFFSIEPTYQDEKLETMTLYGGGYGHGTGMSQNCAKNMALRGMQAEHIIKSFFENIEITDFSAEML